MAAHAVFSTLTTPHVSAQVIFGGPQLIEQSAGAWRALCDESHCAPFYRPEWISTYLKAFEPASEVALFTAHADGKLVAVLPMIRKRAWYAGVRVKMLSGAGNVHSVQFGIAHAPGPVGDSASLAIWNLIKQTPGWHLLHLPMFPAGGSCDMMLQRAQQEGYRTLRFPVQESPVLYMTKDADGKLTWLGGTNRHFRHELRRFARLLEETAGGKPTLLRFDYPEPRVMKQFYALEAAGWKGEEGSAIHCDPATQSFYDQIALEATQRGYFSLHTLDVDGKMAAGAFSVRTNECFYPMKIAHNEEWRRGAPGHLLFNGMLEQCAAANIPEFFFGGSKDRYKTSWTQNSIPHYNGFIFAPGVRGELAFHLRTQVLSRLGQWRRDYRQWREQRSVAKNPVPQHKSAQNSGAENTAAENRATAATETKSAGSQKAKTSHNNQGETSS